jgi:hypothetical protein
MWPELVAMIPRKTLDSAPASYPHPQISSKKARDYQDSDADDDSYGSLLTTGTEASQATLEDPSLNEPPELYPFSSYAEAVMGSAVSLDSAQVSSPSMSTQSEWQKEKLELEAQMKNQAELIEKIQADLQEKISRSHDLEEQLAQALDLAHSRDVRYEEMMAKFDQLLRLQEERMNTENPPPQISTQADTLPTTPARKTKPIASPPTKKANTNASPSRNVYAVFRQPGLGKHQSMTKSFMGTYLKNHRPAPSSPLRLMDTDDEAPPLPPPGAKSGQKIE